VKAYNSQFAVSRPSQCLALTQQRKTSAVLMAKDVPCGKSLPVAPSIRNPKLGARSPRLPDRYLEANRPLNNQ
jgi:hypothetical protein